MVYWTDWLTNITNTVIGAFNSFLRRKKGRCSGGPPVTTYETYENTRVKNVSVYIIKPCLNFSRTPVTVNKRDAVHIYFASSFINQSIYYQHPTSQVVAFYSFVVNRPKCLFCNHMWQSQVEIEHYSVAYFDRITAFKFTDLSLRAGLIHTARRRMNTYMYKSK